MPTFRSFWYGESLPLYQKLAMKSFVDFGHKFVLFAYNSLTCRPELSCKMPVAFCLNRACSSIAHALASAAEASQASAICFGTNYFTKSESGGLVLMSYASPRPYPPLTFS
jgi:hypothetical protein